MGNGGPKVNRPVNNPIDDVLTVGPEPKSMIVGRAQGIYALSGLQEMDLTHDLEFCFHEWRI